ncbi:hypothetical protein COLO4_07890 [Corchorus olitorius]|uniref:Uncharacterized protein n=1 Tax=Corchorus olitorius TaxID=93759 RepID=A0A1R3KI78_9ROSI|nr:hypothetical protein COLO4_07890 [Corchorus olitorius]
MAGGPDYIYLRPSNTMAQNTIRAMDYWSLRLLR